jgi:hypothetical protein
MPRKLIEFARRKVDLDLEICTSITLADGQDWYFPRPWLEIVPHFKDGKAVDQSKLLTCGPELDLLLESIAEEEDPAKEILAVMTLGGFLLLRNYDLTDEELGQLFVYRPRDPASQDMIRSIIEVATGGGGLRGLKSPKACAAGSGSA